MNNWSEPERVVAWARLHYPTYRREEGSVAAAVRRMQREVKTQLNLKRTSNARLRTLLRNVANENAEALIKVEEANSINTSKGEGHEE